MIWRGSRTSKSPTECTDYVGFSQIYSPFYDSRLNFGKGQGFLWKIMPQNVTLKFNLVPFLARGLKWRCFWGGRDFSGSIFNFLPFLCEKCPFLRYLCLLGKVDQFFSQGWELFVQEIGTGLKLCSQPPQFSKKCHEQFYCKNAVFSTAKWLRIWCIQMMHSNFEFTDAPDPEVSGCTWDPVVFWSKFFQRLAALPWSLSDN